MVSREDERQRQLLQGNYSKCLSLVSTLQVLIHSDKSLYRFYCLRSATQSNKMKDHRPSVKANVCEGERLLVSEVERLASN